MKFFLDNSYKDIQKIISQLPFIIDFYEFNTNNDKYISQIQDCHVILIMFDLNNRNSFDNLNDCWLYFLKNHCYYENDIYILGNYIDKSSAPLTSSEEINEMIKFLEIPIANYIEVGNKTNEELNKLIDELVFHTYIDDLKNVKEDCKGGSFKVDKCIVY